MRRALAILLALTTMLAFGPWAPAQADTTVVVHANEYNPEDGSLVLVFRNCSDSTQNGSGAPLLRINHTDDPEWLGQRVHGFHLGSGNAIGPIAWTSTPTTAAYSMRIKPEDGAVSGLVVAYYVAPGDVDGHWVGTAPVTETGTGWRQVTGTTTTLTWHRFDNSTQQWSPAGGGTVRQFALGHGGDGSTESGAGAYLGFALGCDGSRFSYDRLQVGTPDAVTTYDFEGALTKTLIQASASTITAGGPLTLRGAPDEAVSRFAEIGLTLEARPFGELEFVPVGTAVSTWDGTLVWAKRVERPKVRTEYQWVIPSSASTEGSVSPTAVVNVRTAVTSGVADSRLTKGQRLVVTGRTTPRKPGVTTTLQRKKDGRWRTLDTGRTRADGTYRFAHRTTSIGRWTVRVLVAKASGNLAGTSPQRTATVR